MELGLTWADGSIGSDEAHWRSRLAAVTDLRSRPQRELARVAPELKAATDSDSVANCAWLDNTTIGAALDLLGSGGYLSPGTLLDLETFVRTSVLSEHVFHLPNVAAQTDALNERLDERVYLSVPVDGGPDGLGRWSPLSAALYALFWQSSEWLVGRRSDRPQRDEMWAPLVEGWTAILGVPPDPELVAIEHDAGWASPVDLLVTSLGQVTTLDAAGRRPGEALDPMRYRLIAQSTARCCFNMELARTLELPYAPSVVRLPFHRHLVSRQVWATRRVALADVVDDSVRKHIARFSAAGVVLPLPTFVAALLALATPQGDLVPALAELRSRCAALRRHRVDLETALSDPLSSRTEQQIVAALEADALRLSDRIKVAGVTASAVTLYTSLAFASAVPWELVATAGAVRLGADVVPIAERLTSRLRRPYEKCLTDLGRTTRNLRDAVPQLQARWARPAYGTWDDFAAGLAGLGRAVAG